MFEDHGWTETCKDSRTRVEHTERERERERELIVFCIE